ncbi:MAG TPA: DUF2079 domain-containing protein [Roseiflexaceae bacterium]|nr:DUF2079 domain-containing protein [Roseiflexaceae bacterium]
MNQPTSTFRDPLLWLAVALVGGLLGWLSLARYAGFNAGMYDLGNMAQAIWSGAQGGPLLYSRPEGLSASRLAGHVEAGYFLVAPLYALWPNPRLLLALQAALFALGALPAYRIAMRRTGSAYAARCLALIYLLYPTAQTGVLFDFHADTLAAPLLLFALDALDARAHLRYALLAALAMSFKFYIAALVLGTGLVLYLWEGRRRAGALTMAAAGAYGALAFFVVRPLFLPEVSGGVAVASGSYLGYYFGQADQILSSLGDRLLNAVVVFGPALLVAWRGWRWLVPALPVALAALASTGPGGAFDYRYHHYATVVPFIMMAAIDGTMRMRGGFSEGLALPGSSPHARRRSWRGDLGLTLGIVAIFNALLVNTPLNPLFWLRVPGYGLDPSVYGVTPRDAVKERFLAERVPPGAPLAASTFLATRLVNRERVYLVRYPDEPYAERLPHLLPQIQLALPDALFDHYVSLDEGYGGGLDYDRDAIGLLLRDGRFALTGMRDGLLLFERDVPPGTGLANHVARRPDDGAAAVARFGEQLALVRAEVAQVGPRRLRASFTWRLGRAFERGGRYVAVSRLAGVAQARFVHLPTYALLPAWEWRPGELVEETFEVEVPSEATPGTYEWRLGWYDVRHPAAMHTDRRSLLPGSEELAVATVAVR